MSQKGRGIFLGNPIGTPTGISIGRPGLMLFGGTGVTFAFDDTNTTVFVYDSSNTLVFVV